MITEPYNYNDTAYRVAVIVPTHNRWKLAALALDSLINDGYQNKQIYLIDDGSTDETKEHLPNLNPIVKVLVGDGNLWWSGAINLGIKEALKSECNLILWMNDDNKVESNTLENMVNAHISCGSNSIIAARTLSTYTRQDEWCGNPPRWHPDYDRWRGKCQDNQICPLEHPPGGRGVLFPIDCFRTVGFVDQRSFPHYWADHDFHYRAMNAGYKYFLAGNAVVWNTPNYIDQASEGGTTLRSVTRFIFSRRSPMNFPTLRRLLKRHLSSAEFKIIWQPLWKNTLLWQLTELVKSYPRVLKCVKYAKGLINSD